VCIVRCLPVLERRILKVLGAQRQSNGD